MDNPKKDEEVRPPEYCNISYGECNECGQCKKNIGGEYMVGGGWGPK